MDRRAFHASAAALSMVAAMHDAGAQGRAELHTRVIPATGERVPVVGLGTWQVFNVAAASAEYAEARATLKAFVAGGGRVVDSSPMYGRSENVLGDLMQADKLRDRLFVATKVWTHGQREGVAQMGDSMAKLRVDKLDLMQVHNLTDTDAHLETLARWKAEGRVRLVGITHYHAGAHRALEAAMRKHRVDVVQVNYSLAEPEAERGLLDLCAELNVAVIVNRPFAEGALFGAVRGKPVPDWAREEFGIEGWAQFFLKWILGHPAVTVVIPGTRNPKHVADNLAAARGSLPNVSRRERMRAAFAAL
jgi:aryl-alcohol dehydrogenase-like predicted oxidoreductase